MTTSEVFALLDPSEQNAFLCTPVPPKDDCDSPAAIARDAFESFKEFGDPEDMVALHIALTDLAMDLRFRRALETIEVFSNEQNQRGALARRIVCAATEPALPEAVRLFIDSFATVTAQTLLDSRSRDAVRRRRLIDELLADAAAIQTARAA